MNQLSLQQCYELLDLDLDASIAEIDAVYTNKVMEKLRQGTKSEKALLKLANETVRTLTLLAH